MFSINKQTKIVRFNLNYNYIVQIYRQTWLNASRMDDFNWSEANNGNIEGNSSLIWEIAADDKNPAMIEKSDKNWSGLGYKVQVYTH